MKFRTTILIFFLMVTLISFTTFGYNFKIYYGLDPNYFSTINIDRSFISSIATKYSEHAVFKLYVCSDYCEYQLCEYQQQDQNSIQFLVEDICEGKNKYLVLIWDPSDGVPPPKTIPYPIDQPQERIESGLLFQIFLTVGSGIVIEINDMPLEYNIPILTEPPPEKGDGSGFYWITKPDICPSAFQITTDMQHTSFNEL